MNYHTPRFGRNGRTFVASLLAYLLLTSQLTPVAFALNRAAARRSDSTVAEVDEKKVGEGGSEGTTVTANAPAPVPIAGPMPGGPAVITATKTDTYPSQPGPAVPGETLTYSITITNSGGTDATNVTLTDTVDPNTTIVPGSPGSTPIGTDDTYNVVGNVRIQPNAAQGVLANDNNPNTGNNTGLTASGPNTGPSNGQLTLNSDGSFSYNPNPGFTGTDTFTYTLTNANGSDTASVSLVVGNGADATGNSVIWFVDPAAAAGGDGRLTSPFNCYTGPAASCFSTTAADDAGDTIFLYSGAHVGGYALLANQELVGQAATATLASLGGFTVPAYSDPLPTTGGASPTITTSIAATNAIPVSAGGITLRGFTVGNTTGAKISGTSFGTLTVGNNVAPDVILNGTGQALNLSTGTFAATSGFISVSTTSSATQGISIAGVAGSVSFGSTTVSGATTQGILVGTSTANISFGNTSVTGGTDAVSLQNNSAGTRTFGSLTISGNSGVGFLHAVGGGAVSVTGTTSITSGGVGIDVDSSNANLSFAMTTVIKSATSGIGVDLTNNATRTIDFTSLFVQTQNGFALNTNNSGTVNVGGGALTQSGAGGGAASLTNTTLNLTFTSMSSDGGANGILISGGSGTLATGTTTLQNNAGIGLSMSSSGVAANFGTTIVNSSAGDAVDLSSNTANITFGDLDLTPDANLRGLDAQNNTGTITSTSGDIAATGAPAVFIDGPAGRTPLAMVLNNVDSTNSAQQGISIVDASGSFTVNDATLATNIVNPTGIGINLTNNTATFSFANTVVSGSGGTGVVLGTAGNGNTGAVTFADLDISPDNGQRALHSVASTGTITVTSGTITTNNGAAGGGNVGIEIVGPSSASRTPISLIFDTVSVNNALNGIVITNASDAGNGFRTLGTGTTDGSGGAITNITNRGASFIFADDIQLNNMTFTNAGTVNGADPTLSGSTCGDLFVGGNTGCNAAIHLQSATGVALTNVDISGGLQEGINGNSVTNFTLTNSTVTNVGDQVREDGLRFLNMLGTSSITNTTFTNNEAVQIHVENNTGSLGTSISASNLNVQSTGLAAAPNGSHGFLYVGSGSANADITIQNSTFNNLFSNSIHTDSNSSGVTEVTITGSTFTNVGASGITMAQDGSGAFRFNISNNGTAAVPTFLRGTNTGSSHSINVNQAGNAPQSAVMEGQILNNFIGNNSSPTAANTAGNGIRVLSVAPGTLTVLISGNTIQNPGANGIQVQMSEDTNANHRVNATVTNNNATVSDVNSFDGFFIQAGALTGDAGTMCLDLVNNDGSATAAGNDFTVRQRFITTLQLPGYTGANNDNAALQTFLDITRTNDPVGAGNNWFITNNVAGGGGGFVNTPAGAPCPQPTLPSAPETFDEKPDEGSAPKTSAVAGVSAISTPSSNSITTQPVLAAPQQQPTSAISQHAVAGVSAQTVPKALQSEKSGKSQEKVGGKRDTIVPNPPVIMGDTITWNVGTLPAGQSVTITFQVVVDNPYSGGPNVSNQGTITADGGISVLTDDPDTPGMNEPTLTPIAAPANIFIRDGRAAEPASGTTNMLFTVALATPASGTVTVDFATEDQPAGPGHAVAGVDYTATMGTVTFNSGEQVKTIPVPILSDSESETDETFLVNLSNATNGTIADGQAVGTITVNNPPGTVLISELRTFGPGPTNDANDDFVELYNNTDSPITVPAGGYGLFKMGATCDATPVLIGTVPAGTVIPARGHFLFTGSAYSLANYGGTGAAAGDATLTADIENNGNVALFSTTDVSLISSENRLDAVGFGTQTTSNCALLLEGNSLTPLTSNLTALGQHSFVRDNCGKGGSLSTLGACPTNGLPKDSNDNAVDFYFVDTNGVNAGAGQRLGAPGPENLTSPIRLDAPVVLLDASVAAAAPPNRVRDLTSDPGNNSTFGTLSIRRRFQNNTASSITRLRFRIIDLSTFPTAPPVTADLRARTSADFSVTVNDAATCAATGTPSTPPCTVTVNGTTLETPPAQPNGGGFNSTLAAGTISTGTPLAPGASINVQFLLGVQQTGNFKFFIIIEALP